MTMAFVDYRTRGSFIDIFERGLLPDIRDVSDSGLRYRRHVNSADFGNLKNVNATGWPPMVTQPPHGRATQRASATAPPDFTRNWIDANKARDVVSFVKSALDRC